MSVLIMIISVVRFFPDPGVMTLIGVFFLTLPGATSFVLPPAIYADVVDYDEELTGVRREGIYAGSVSFCNKICLAIGSASIVYILSLGHNREVSPLSSFSFSLCTPAPRHHSSSFFACFVLF